MKSLRGVAQGGERVDPGELPEEPVDATDEPRAAPAPGLPIAEEEYRRLKEAAKHAPVPRVKNAKEDRPNKKKRITPHR